MFAFVDFTFLFAPLEQLDSWLTGLFEGAPLLVALGVAFLLGLRHASDPDHLVAVTSLVAADGGNTRDAARLGAWWGIGHAAVLLLIGIPLILFKSVIPAWLEAGAEKAIGVVIILLAGRVILKWIRGDFRADRHAHGSPSDTEASPHRHLHEADSHGHRHIRTPRQAFAIGTLHGLAGTGAVVVLLITALPTQFEAMLALAVFAPMSVLSMVGCTSLFAWVLTRRLIDPLYRTVLIPFLGLFGVIFGAWYAGIG